MRWCEENTLNFVKFYLAKECLWNPAHDWYKIRCKREDAYAEIISEFEALTGKCMSVSEVKIKIKNLRSTYTQQVQKILQKSSPDSIYKPSLIWFHEMDRCLKYVPIGRTFIADFNQEMHEEAPEQTEWTNQDRMFASSLKDESSDPLFPLHFTDNEYESTTQESVVLKIEPDSSSDYSNIFLQRRKKKKQKKSSQYTIRSHDEISSNEDEFDIYGKYIASQLRKLDLQRALKLQIEIQNLVNEARVSVASD